MKYRFEQMEYDGNFEYFELGNDVSVGVEDLLYKP